MAKKFPVNKIKGHHIYSMWEVSDALGCHKQTVARWIKLNGLVADTSSKPWLIDGRDLKVFLGQKTDENPLQTRTPSLLLSRLQGSPRARCENRRLRPNKPQTVVA